MLVFLVLCAHLRTLQSAPLLPPHALNFVDAVNLMGRDAPIDPACGGPQCRTVYSIVQTCLVTIFACVWKSLHPNINGPIDSDWTCFKRKVVTMVIAVIAPELVFLWALRQRRAAMEIAKEYNKNFAKSGESIQIEKSLRGKVVDWFLSLWGTVMVRFLQLSEETTRRGVGQSWSTTHGYFIQMGGFILYENEYPKEVLGYDRLEELLRKKSIDAPTVTERNLQDRSKGDTISKAIVVLQTTWFIFQCIARTRQRLPLSELEVLTLAFALMNLAIYAVWWNKPQGVDTAICVPLKESEKVIADATMPLMGQQQQELTNPSHAEPANLPQPNSHYSNDNVPLVLPPERRPNISTGKTHGLLRRKLREVREQHSSPFFFLVSLTFWLVLSVVRPLGKIMTTDKFNKSDLRMPMFYASDRHYSEEAVSVASYGVGAVFGAIHLLAWASEFPSPRDLVLWRVSATVLTVTPFLMCLFPAMEMLRMGSLLEKFVIAKNCLGFLILFLIPFYIVGRVVVIIIALLAIHDPPRAVLRDISWTLYIPHF